MADAETPDVAALVRELYGAAPSDFVAERKRLAATLKAAGAKDAAASFAKLRKPTVLEDALNRTARSDPDTVEAWATAVAATEKAQSAAIGGGDASALRTATAELRTATAALVKAATKHAGTAKALDLGTELQVLTGTASGVSLLRHGVLGSAEPGEATELFAGAPEPPARRPAPARSTRPERAQPPDDDTDDAHDTDGTHGAVDSPRDGDGADDGAAANTRRPGARGRNGRADVPRSGRRSDDDAIDTTAATRRASAQAIKRHEAAVAKATRARDITAREVARLTGELEQAQAKLAQLDQTLADLEASAPH